jgi:hypothetical protein
VVIAAVFFVRAITGGGDTPAAIPLRTPTVGPSPAGAAAPTFTPASETARYIRSVSPAKDAKVTQESTRSPNVQVPQGLCANVSFEDLPENAQWYRLAFDDAEVTQKITWVVKSQADPKDGRLCYSPPEGFKPGTHKAVIVVANPLSRTEPPRQVLEWSFEVTP